MVVIGESGTAKTTECANLAKAKEQIFITISANETPSSLMNKLCLEAGIAPRTRTTQMETALTERLGSARKAVFVDEADFLFRSRRHISMIESLRIIHDLSIVPLILIGLPELELHIARYKHLDRRIVERVYFVKLTLDDATSLATDLCEVGIAPDVLLAVHQKFPFIGDFLNCLEALESESKAQGWEALSLPQYQKLAIAKGRI